jgi:hypothetical protein
MTGYVANPLSGEMLQTLRDELAEFQIDENFSTSVFLCLKSSRLTPEGKSCFLGLVAERLENEFELLDVQIESYDFQDPKQFLESLPPPKREEIVIPFDLQIEEGYGYEPDIVELESRFNLDEEIEKVIQDQLVIESLKGISINYEFMDPVADYMKNISSSIVHIHLQSPLHCTPWVFWTKGQVVSLMFLINNQEVNVYKQLLDWLHWHYCII